MMQNPTDPKDKQAHTIADHCFGEYLRHVHDGDADHDHDYFETDGSPEDNPLWQQDHVSLLSVGLDIDSAGTQVTFSRLNLRRLGEELPAATWSFWRRIFFSPQFDSPPTQPPA